MQRVPVDTDDGPVRGQRDEVAADPAAQVGHRATSGEPRRAVPGGDLAGRLLQTVAGQHHVLGAGELRLAAVAEALQREPVGHEARGEPGAQAVREPQRRLVGHPLGPQQRHQLPPLGPVEGREPGGPVVGEVHAGKATGRPERS